MKWTAQRWLLAASLLGNAVFGLALFFKSALNEILVTKFRTRSARAERQRELMVELHGRLESFDANYFLLLAANALRYTAAAEEVRQQNQKTLDTLSPKQIDTLEFFARHDLEFPSVVRNLLLDLRKAIEFEDIERVHDLQAILDRSELVARASGAVRAELNRLVN